MTKHKTPADWPGAFGIFKPSMRTVGFNVWTYLATLVVSFIVQLLPDASHWISRAPIAAIIATIVGYIASFIMSAAGTVTLLAATQKEALTLEDAVRLTLPRTWRFIGATILTSVIGLVSLLLLIIPFFFIFPRLQLATYFVLDKDLGVIDALKASWEQTKGQVGKIYGIIGATIVMVLPAFTIVGIPVTVFLLIAYSAALVVLYRYLQSGDIVFAKPAAE